MTESASGIVEDRDGDAVTVTIARPEKRNALSTSALSGLAEVFERLAGDRGLRFVVSWYFDRTPSLTLISMLSHGAPLPSRPLAFFFRTIVIRSVGLADQLRSNAHGRP